MAITEFHSEAGKIQLTSCQNFRCGLLNIEHIFYVKIFELAFLVAPKGRVVGRVGAVGGTSIGKMLLAGGQKVEVIGQTNLKTGLIQDLHIDLKTVA